MINTAYRFQRDVSEQLDVSWQWPLNDLWGDRGLDLGTGRGQGPGRYYSVGRMNYSMNEGRLVDTVLGVEYDAGCWLGRLVFERVQTSTSSATERLMFQLEFVGFTRLGIDPRKTLTQNISRYQNLRDSAGSNSRFGNYDETDHEFSRVGFGPGLYGVLRGRAGTVCPLGRFHCGGGELRTHHQQRSAHPDAARQRAAGTARTETTTCRRIAAHAGWSA